MSSIYPNNRPINPETKVGYEDEPEMDDCDNCGQYSLEFIRNVGDSHCKYKCQECGKVEIRY